MIEKNLNGFEVIFLLNLIPALRVKDVTLFDLLDQEFHYGEFAFFPRLAAHLGKIAGISASDAQDVGILSVLFYLSSKVHNDIMEQPGTQAQLQGALQMPVLLGDYLYSWFLLNMVECDKICCVPVYLSYLEQFNQQKIDTLLLQDREDSAQSGAQLMAQKTAEAITVVAQGDARMQDTLETAADNFYQEQWSLLYGEKINSLEALEARIQAAIV